MTRTTNARIAGFTYLFYIAVAFPMMVLYDRATRAEGIAAKLTGIAQHATEMRVVVVLSLLCSFAALVLAVTLYGITRDEDHDLAMLALNCRVGEGVFNAIAVVETLGLIWLATAGGANGPDAATADALGGLAFKLADWNGIVSATLFAAGSTLFSWLLLRGRMIPAWLAWLGVLGSALVLLTLSAQLAGFTVTKLVWIPVAVFELTLGPWLIIRGVPRSQEK